MTYSTYNFVVMQELYVCTYVHRNMVRSRTKLQEEVQAKLQEQLGLSILNLGSAFGAVSIACYLGKQVSGGSPLCTCTSTHTRGFNDSTVRRFVCTDLLYSHISLQHHPW